MMYKHAKAMLLTLEPNLARLVKQYRENALDEYYRTLVAPVVDILDQAERYIQKADAALSAFTQRIIRYRGRDFTEIEQLIYQETSLNIIDEIKWKHEGSPIMRIISQEKRDYSIVISIEQAFKEGIPGYVRPVMLSRYEVIVVTPSYELTSRHSRMDVEDASFSTGAAIPLVPKDISLSIDSHGFIERPLSDWVTREKKARLLLSDHGVSLNNRIVIDSIKEKLKSSEEGKYLTVGVPMLKTGMARLFRKAVSKYIVFQREFSPEGGDEVMVRVVNDAEWQKVKEPDDPVLLGEYHRIP